MLRALKLVVLAAVGVTVGLYVLLDGSVLGDGPDIGGMGPWGLLTLLIPVGVGLLVWLSGSGGVDPWN